MPTIKSAIKKNKLLFKIALFLYKAYAYVNGYAAFVKDYLSFKKCKSQRFELSWRNRFPRVFDRTVKTGFDRHYVCHTAWASRVLAKINPAEHIDISSLLMFSANLSAFISVKFYDYRPADFEMDNFCSGKADLLNLPFGDNSAKSISCMHTVEHVGLGRYGDSIDPDGDLKAIKELKRVLAKDGDLIFVVPVGKPKIQFNAHRIYSYDQIVDYFEEFELVEFALVPDDISKGIIRHASKEESDKQKYGCGCFWFKK